MESRSGNVDAAATSGNVESLLVPTLETPPPDRRREPRFAADRLTLFQVSGSDDRERTLCRILDVSKGGMRIRTQHSMQPGTEIRVTLREMFAFAQVRYSIRTQEGFDHGIRVHRIASAPAAPEQQPA